MTSEMSAYFPFQGTANDYLFRADDLAVAYEMTDFYIGARVGREFWREEVQTNFATLDLTAEGMAAKNEDASLALALQLSEEDLLEISDSDEEDNLDLYEAPSPPRRRSQQVPLRTAQQIILPFTKKADRGPGDKRKCNNDTTQTVKDSQLDRGNYRNPHKSRECSSSMDEQQIEVEDHVSLDESASGSDSEPEDADMGELEE